MDPQSTSSPAPPLPRSYADPTVLQLEPLCDTFFARELGQRRFSEKLESEWVASVAKDVRENERTVRTCFLSASFYSTFFKTDVVKRWLKAISLSTKREFCNFVPPLTDEAFQLFVQFFWNIKAGNRLKANQLLRNARQRQWGLEPSFFPLTINKFLESGDDPAVLAAESSRSRYSMGQTVQLTGKSRKTLNIVGRKRNNRSISSAITKRRATARPNFKKRRLTAKVRLEPEATNSASSQNEKMIVDECKWRCRCTRRSFLASGSSSLSNGYVDVPRLENVASNSVEKRQSKKRKVRCLAFHDYLSHWVIKLKNDDAEYLEPQESRNTVLKPRPRGDKRVKAEANSRKRVKELQRVVEATGDGPELLHHSVARPNEPYVVPGDSLVPEHGMLSRSNPNTTSLVGVDPRPPERASRKSTKPSRKSRSSALNISSRSADASQTLGKMAEGRVTAEPDQVVDHTVTGVPESRMDRKRSLPPFTFENVGEDVPEDEDEPCDCSLSDYPIISSIGLEEKKNARQLPRPLLPVTPRIWAQVRRIFCGKDSC